MSYKRYCLYALLITILFPCNALFNYVFNPYEIFTHNLAPKGIHHVQRYEKIGYLKTHHNDFETHHIPDIDTLFLNRIFQRNIDSMPKDFGIFINKENFKQSLKTMHEIESRFSR